MKTDVNLTDVVSTTIALWFIAVVLSIPWFFLTAWFVQLLWNWLIPSIIGWGTITYWQAVGMKLLFRFLIKVSSSINYEGKK